MPPYSLSPNGILGQLRTLIHVAEFFGSLSKAADRLRIARSRLLSRQVRMLEEELGIEIFTRHGRGMVLTWNRAATFLEHAVRISSELEEIRSQRLRTSKRRWPGRSRSGLPPTVADIISVPLVAAFCSSERRSSAGQRVLTCHLMIGCTAGKLTSLLYDPRTARSLRPWPLLENLFLIGRPRSGLLHSKGCGVLFAGSGGQAVAAAQPPTWAANDR